MRLLVTGASGQLGQALRAALEPRHEVVWTDLEDLDVRDLAGVRGFIGEQRPQAVLHLAATTQVDACESRPEATYEINALGTRYVAVAAAEAGAEMVFISTDYVFNGRSDRPYLEYDDCDPLNVYGLSKLYGERVVTAVLPRHYIVRTSGLFGPGGRNFIAAILAAHARGERLRVVRDQICRPTFAEHLAEALRRIVGSGAYGTYHVASTGEASWFDVARAVLEEAGHRADEVEPIASGELGRPARRPAYSVLDTRAYELTFGHALPNWREGLRAYLARA
jgi:dTDP-4-dehydrorhamnose reductase